MRTFLEYKILRDYESIIQEISEVAENNPAFNQILTEAGFWGNLGQGIKNFAQGAWSGLKAGGQTAWSAMTGPLTQFNNAIGALNKAAQAVAKDDTLKQSTTTGTASLPAMNLGQWLADTVKELQSQSSQLQNKQLNPAKSGYGPAAQPGTFTDPATGKPYQQQVAPGTKVPAPTP